MGSQSPESGLPTQVVPHAVIVATCVTCLRNPVTARYLLADYVPVQHFGGFESVKAVTIGINPAPNKVGRRGLPLVSGFGRTSRADLHDNDLISISEFQTTYFDDGKAHTYFDNSFYFVLHTIDKSWTYQSGTVAHIDTVFCVTYPLWSVLGRADPDAQATIRRNCRTHFFRTLESIPPGTWLLWGGQETVKALNELKPRIDAKGITKEKQVSWQMGQIEIKGSAYPFIAWDKVGPGMSNDDRCEIGEVVKRRILDLAQAT